MINPLITVLSLPDLLAAPVATSSPVASQPSGAQQLPEDGQSFRCPVTGHDTIVYGVIAEPEAGHVNHWWGCWACAALYWHVDMPFPVQKSWHCVRVPLVVEPTPADYLGQLITEFVAMRDVAETILVDLPPDPDYHAHLDELVMQCRAVVQDLREREASRRPRAITVRT